MHCLFHSYPLSLDLKRTGLAIGSIRRRQPFSRQTSQPSLGSCNNCSRHSFIVKISHALLVSDTKIDDKRRNMMLSHLHDFGTC